MEPSGAFSESVRWLIDSSPATVHVASERKLRDWPIIELASCTDASGEPYIVSTDELKTRKHKSRVRFLTADFAPNMAHTLDLRTPEFRSSQV